VTIKKLKTAVLTIICSLTVLYSSAMAFALTPADINAQSAILIDSDSHQMLFEKNSHELMFPASTTKLMTALLILENHELNETVTIDSKSPMATGSRIYIIEGEILTIEQMLHALLLASANDVAEALAIYDSGSIEAFAEKMNQRAAELGALNTHFTNPHGLPDPEHVTTAYDLSRIALEAIKHEKLREIVKTISYDIPPTNKQPENRHFANSNRFLYGTGSGNKIDYRGQTINIKYDAITGLKTGYTNAAQQCFISSATKDGKNLISVILKAQGNFLYLDTRTLIDYGFENFNAHTFASKHELISYFEYSGNKKVKIPLYSSDDIKALIPNSLNPEEITFETEMMPEFELPVKEGQRIGTIRYFGNGKLLTEAPLITLNEITDKSALGETTLFNHSWLRFDTSPKALVLLGIKVILSLMLWRLIMSKLNKKTRRRPSSKATTHPAAAPSTRARRPDSTFRPR
jgi:D-alanyl-D-alanine carboxypeptidase (penicillin-binding protein 5/6)